MKIKFAGAAREVTGSRHIIEVNGKKILLDCGLFQGHRKQAEEKNRKPIFNAEEIDVVILSHAHIDHSGGLPLLVKNGFNGPIYSTHATRDLCSHMLMDSAYIQEKDVEYLNKKLAKKGEPLVEPLYTKEDAAQALNLFVGVNYEKAFPVIDGVIASFYDAGHILGSSQVHLIIHDQETDKRHTLGFTGDLGRVGLPILRDPQPLPPSEFLLTESTYGDRLHESIDDAGKALKACIERTFKRGGKILIPAFSVERTQELVYHLNVLWQNKEIPDIPIFVDSPLAANVTEVFINHPECYDHETFEEFIMNRKNPFGFGKLTYTRDVEESKALNSLNGPAIIISASGMCENGRILHHLKNNIEDPRTTILIVGFMAQGTNGRKLVEGNEVINIFGETYRLRAEVVKINAFSGHADRDELTRHLKRVEGLQKIFLVHGEEEQAAVYEEFLKPQVSAEIFRPALGDEFDL